MVEILVSFAEKVSGFLVDSVVHQLGYVFNYGANIKDLSAKVEKLKDARTRHKHSADEARGNGHIIEDDVNNWLTRADSFIREAEVFLEDEKGARKSCFKGLCPDFKSRHRLGREAVKKAGVAAQIYGEGQFGRVSYRPPLQEIRSAPSEALASRMWTLNQVMEALRDANVNKMGVWGMGGVGKSRLLNQVAQQAAQEKLFDKVVTASVLQTPDTKRIQGELADKLDMKLEEETEQGKAARLHQRMKQEKTILVVLDDLWAEVDLERIGIPSPGHHSGCKLLLSSRNRDVLTNEMGSQKDFRVELLQENEAWILFKNMAGDAIEDPDLEPIAMEIAKECAGLPLAIVTLAKALRNKSDSIWRDALQQLKRPTSTNVAGMGAKVFSSLELSYKHLEGDELKSFFLLCGIIISINYVRTVDLLKYGMGLRLFDGTNTLNEAKNRIDTLIDSLKASNLLLETGCNAVVRMHDVVRNVAVKLASKEHHVLALHRTNVIDEEWAKTDELAKVTWVCLDDSDIPQLPEELVCPKLELFRCCPAPNSTLKIPNTFFYGMKQVKVLELANMHLPSLPSSLPCLVTLRTLCLNACKLGDILIITQLKKLEILSITYSDIEQLPREITQLTHLRMLALDGSFKLQGIPEGVLSRLSRLEDLCMGSSFTQWEVEGKCNACLDELKHLSHLTTLDIQILDAELLPKDIVFDNLVRYRIFVGDDWIWEENYRTNRTLKLDKFDTSLHMVDGISKLLKRTEDLHLRELRGGTRALSRLDKGGFLKLKHLNVENSQEIECILNSMDLTPSRVAFPVMETLCLYQLINLQEVFYGQFPKGSFGCLKKVEVGDCNGLKFLFFLSMARGFSKLEEIKVTGCKSMVEMVSQERKEIKEHGAGVSLFPELKCLILQDLPKLSNLGLEENFKLSKPICTIAGPSASFINQPEIRDSQLLLCLGSNLRYIMLEKCMSLVKLFPASLLQNLQALAVENCDNLEQVFDVDGMDNVGQLPKLEYLSLIGLPKLRYICKWGSSRNHFPSSSTASTAEFGSVTFPKLIHLFLKSLPALTSFSPEHHSLQAHNTPSPVLFDERVAFPCLELLNISRLEKVKKIWHNKLAQDSFLKLKWVVVESCGEVLNIFPSCMLERLQSLQILMAADCGSLEVVFDGEAGMHDVVNVKEGGASVTPLSKLLLNSLPKLEKIWNKDPHGIISFRELKSITIGECPSLKRLFPASLVKDLEQLEELHLLSCGIEEIIGKDDEEEAETAAPTFVFPKVTALSLGKLPQLQSFYPGPHTSEWPSLVKLMVFECSKLTIFSFVSPTLQLDRFPCSDNGWIMHDTSSGQ